MTVPGYPANAGMVRVAMLRGIAFLIAWILIAGASPSDLPAGMIVAAVASLTSLILYPRGARRIRFAPLIGLSVRLLLDSVVAGLDIALRALDPRLPLKPGLIRYGSDLPPGRARAAFSAMIGLVPGTLCVGQAADGTLLVHCLDETKPVIAALARDEAVLRRALGEG